MPRIARAALLPALALGCYASYSDGDADRDVADVRPDDGGGEATTCEIPAPDSSWMELTIDDGGYDEVDIDTPCVVAAVDTEGIDRVTLRLECGTGGIMVPHTLAFRTSPPIGLDPWLGQEVQLRYHADVIWWINRHLTLRDAAGGLILAYVAADSPFPDGEDPTAWYAPLGLSIARGICPARSETCGDVERVAFRVTYGGETDDVLDLFAAPVGGLESVLVFVSRAIEYASMECDDVPERFYTALFVVQMEG